MALVAYLERDYAEAEEQGRQMMKLAIEAGDRYREASAYGVFDRVYILRADGDAGTLAELRQVFDAVVGSIEWVK